MENKEFNYTYTAPTERERREIEGIRKQYQDPEKSMSKLERLRALDARVKNTANVVALIVGIVGTLIFGVGLCLVLEWAQIVWGIVVAAIGVIPIALAYPLYTAVLKTSKKKYGEEILRLSEELLKGDEGK